MVPIHSGRVAAGRRAATLAAAALFLWTSCARVEAPEESQAADETAAAAPIPTSDWHGPPQSETPEVLHETPFPRNSSLHQVLIGLGAAPARIHQLVSEVRPVYNLARVRAGHRLAVGIDPQGGFTKLEYDISDEEFLLVETLDDGFRAERRQRPFQQREQLVQGCIDTSLWQSLIDSGEGPQMAAALASVFQWDVDFSSLQKGDSYSAIVEKRFREGSFVKYGRILAARITSGSKDFHAFLFRDSLGQEAYFDDQGKAVRKAFLKAPFSFNPRVTSGFSYRRFHPVHKKWRPHLGVDYGAPVGTPVLASAAGKVTYAGRKGGFGKYVKIRHPNGFATSYGHLSRIEVRSGQAVAQGQRIGRVGATGVVTGPHLDYRVQNRAGRFLNPRKVIALPSDKPVEREHWSEFAAVRDAFLRRLNEIRPQGCELDSLAATD